MGQRASAIALLTLASILFGPRSAAAEWQIKPFVGLKFGADTTFLLNDAAGDTHVAFGVGGLLLGEVFGVEADVARVPGFFKDGELVLGSSVTTLTGNVVVALPRDVAEYGLRPYFVVGSGLITATVEDNLQVLPIAAKLAVIDVGGGATGFLTSRAGVSWDVRWFRSVGGKSGTRNSIGPEQISFWRASMAVAIRY
jgi:hypothetical protein